VGPFYRHGTTVLSAAIEAKVSYVDICDDYDATREMLLLDAAAKRAGITALPTLGCSPGAVNILAVYGAKKLEQVEAIRILWCQNYFAGGGGAGSGLHGLHMMKGDIPQFLDGKLVNVPAGSGREVVTFPNGVAEVFYVGHAEPMTIPAFVPGVKTVVNKGVVTPAWVSEEQLKMIELGFGEEEEIVVRRGLTVIPAEVALRIQNMHLKGKDIGEPFFGLLVEVIGTKGGNRAKYTYTLPPEMTAAGSVNNQTAGSLAAGVLMIARGEVSKKGVVTPEVLDPMRYFGMSAKWGIFYLETEMVPRKIVA